MNQGISGGQIIESEKELVLQTSAVQNDLSMDSGSPMSDIERQPRSFSVNRP